jgi:sigma-B regulation protein RsbU (phosphoserine phosphatase)
MTRRRTWWLTIGAILVVAAAVIIAIDSKSGLAVTAVLLAALWLLASAWIVAWWIWRWMTYRVGVRLFISYLLLGVLPFVFCAALAAVGLYILMGQYTSVRFGSEIRRVGLEAMAECRSVLHRADTEGSEAAIALLEELASTPPEPLSRVLWQANIGGQTFGIEGGEDLPEIGWVGGEDRRVPVLYGDEVYGLVSASSQTGDSVVVLIPFDDATAAAISEAWWFDIAFFGLDDHTVVEVGATEEDEEATVGADSDAGVSVTLGGQTMSGQEIWQPWKETEGGFLTRPLVVWFRVSADLVDLKTGEPIKDVDQVALLRTSPSNVWDDFTLSRYELGAEIWGVLLALTLFFLILYGLAFAVAGTIVFSITRSVQKLSTGARQVEDGNLDHRVPTKRRDQLGDLSRSFNHMTDSVQSMLADVAEKERLAHELELARQIQESLLPARHLELGPLTVHATFQPATEVGGDYFDIFPLADERLVVAVGDVAGHGLATGLLMASLKSSVASLVYEGYSGADLITKVNHVMMNHGQSRTMITLTLIEIDLVEGFLSLSNAGHTPAFLIGADGEIEELAANSIPVGSSLCRPAQLARPFLPGSRLLLYSDGLVEAVSPEGEPYGYERLERLLEGAAEVRGNALTALILESLDDYTHGATVIDDLTLLVLERS